MDYEAKLILERLIEAINNNQVDLEQLVNAINNSIVDIEPLVKAVNSPDWWIIVLTAINTIAVIVIAWMQYRMQLHQTKLQEQQAKAQEYDIYKKLYTLIKKINLQIDNFIITAFTFYIPERNSQDNPFVEYIDKASDLLDNFTKNTIDFELKFPNEKVILKNYQFMLVEMLVIYKMFHIMLSIEKRQGEAVSMDEKTSLDCLIGDDAKRVEVLLSLIPNEKGKSQMTNKLKGFLQNKDVILEQNFIGIIANRCKMD